MSNMSRKRAEEVMMIPAPQDSWYYCVTDFSLSKQSHVNLVLNKSLLQKTCMKSLDAKFGFQPCHLLCTFYPLLFLGIQLVSLLYVDPLVLQPLDRKIFTPPNPGHVKWWFITGASQFSSLNLISPVPVLSFLLSLSLFRSFNHHTKAPIRLRHLSMMNTNDGCNQDGKRK